MRARQPDYAGLLTGDDGVEIGYELYEGPGGPMSRRNVVFAPPDPIVDSRLWKAQVPYIARYARVVTIDPRGNGRSGRPTDPESYRDERFAADIIAVMDKVGMEQALLVGICSSSWFSFVAAVTHPERVLGVFSV